MALVDYLLGVPPNNVFYFKTFTLIKLSNPRLK